MLPGLQRHGPGPSQRCTVSVVVTVSVTLGVVVGSSVVVVEDDVDGKVVVLESVWVAEEVVVPGSAPSATVCSVATDSVVG